MQSMAKDMHLGTIERNELPRPSRSMSLASPAYNSPGPRFPQNAAIIHWEAHRAPPSSIP